MNLEAEIFSIRLPHPFRIAHGTSTTRETLLVHLREGDISAHGEGALPPYYPSRADACLAWTAALDPARPLPPAPPEAAAARVAVEMALHDLAAQRAGQPLWKIWGLNPSHLPPCPTTLSIPENETALAEAINQAVAAGAPALKLKSGSGDADWDRRCADLVAARGIPFSVDANGGWPPDVAAAMIRHLGDRVEFVEQPVGRELDHWRELRQRLTGTPVPPLVADESLQTDRDLEALVGLADGVNVKILKAGGLTPARQWISRARQCGLRVMVGVMVETGIGRTAAAHLAPAADWLDIDPPSSIPTTPWCGFAVEGGKLILSGRPGLGLTPMLADLR